MNENKDIKEEKEEERQERQQEIAKKMLEENIDINLIAKITGLTKEEIETLKN